MNLRQLLALVLAVAVAGVAWFLYGWGGVALAVTAFAMWVLLQLNRTMQILKRAADRPMGYIDSAVMFNAKLKRGATLLHLIARTRALGQPLSPENEQPEIFRWTDPGDSSVTCEFQDGKLVKWQLHRPEAPEDGPASGAP